MAIEVDVFKMIDVVADMIQNNSPLSKEAAKSIVTEKDIIYDEADPKTCVLDAYHIPKADGKYPVLMYIHGGGFVAGDKRFRRGVSRWYAELGAYVFNVNYGLCPDYKYPEPLVHLFTALEWIASRADELNLDLDKIFVSGDSAGAYYAAMMISVCNTKRLQTKLGIAPQAHFSAAVFNCGLYDVRAILDAKMVFDINTRIFRNFSGMSDADFDKYPLSDLCEPTAYIDDEYPPVFLVYSKKDLLCSGQAERFIAELEKHGIYHEYYFSNLFVSNHCFPLNWKGRDAERANAMTADFVGRFFRGELPTKMPPKSDSEQNPDSSFVTSKTSATKKTAAKSAPKAAKPFAAKPKAKSDPKAAKPNPKAPPKK